MERFRDALQVVLNATARGFSTRIVCWRPARPVGTVAVPAAAVLNSTRIASTLVVPTLAPECVPAGVKAAVSLVSRLSSVLPSGNGNRTQALPALR